jgi:hypothetical protein
MKNMRLFRGAGESKDYMTIPRVHQTHVRLASNDRNDEDNRSFTEGQCSAILDIKVEAVDI